MSEYIITLEQIKELVKQSATEAMDGYKSGVIKQIWSFPKLPKIVRCKSCKYYDECWTSEVYTDRHWCDRLTVYMPPNGFCSFGERREV